MMLLNQKLYTREKEAYELSWCLTVLLKFSTKYTEANVFKSAHGIKEL